ncbi:MAG: thioredoxin family protein [Fuerstia sp.]|nr:thioredoxin family protein [Fuerstiella sp.]
MLKQVFLVVCVVTGLAARRFAAKAPRVIVAGLLLTATPHFAAQANAGSEGRTEGWGANFEKAETLAKEKGVPLVIHFHAHWCGPCRTMESEVLNTAEVRAVLGSGIVGVKVNSDDRSDLVSRFGISSLPTDVIVSPDGTILSKDVGSPGRSGYVARLGRFRVPSGATVGRSNSLVAQVPGSSAKTPATAASQERIAKDLHAAADRVEEQSHPQDAGSVVPIDRAGETTVARPVVAMTRTVRRESDKRIGLNGYSPVSLTETEEWKAGEAQFNHEFQGVCYQLSSAEELERFKASPDKFIPALHGFDPVSLVKDQVFEAGHLELGVTYQSRVYFFSSKDTRDEFLNSPEKFSRNQNLSIFTAQTES